MSFFVTQHLVSEMDQKKYETPKEGPQKPPLENSKWKHPAVAGAAAGFLETTALFWTVKWNIYRNSSLPFAKSVSQLYRGYGLQLTGMMPLFSVMTTVHDSMQKKLMPPNATEMPMSGKIMVGLLSGGISTVVSPIEMLQVQKAVKEAQMPAKPMSALDVARTAYAEAGVKAFTAGAGLSAVRNGIYSLGVNVFAPMVKEQSVQLLPEDTKPIVKKAVGTVGVMAVGVASGVLSQPMHTVKTLMQSDIKRQRFRSPWDAVVKVYNGEVYKNKKGIRAFMTGSMPRNFRIAAGSVLVSSFLSQYPKKEKSS